MPRRDKIPPDDYEPISSWLGEEENLSCNSLGCDGDCACYESGFDAGFAECQSNTEETYNDEIVITLHTASKEVERIFRERILALDGEEIFKGDKLAGSEAARMRSLWEKVKKVFE